MFRIAREAIDCELKLGMMRQGLLAEAVGKIDETFEVLARLFESGISFISNLDRSPLGTKK
jgi:hypothetical protein